MVSLLLKRTVCLRSRAPSFDAAAFGSILGWERAQFENLEKLLLVRGENVELDGLSLRQLPLFQRFPFNSLLVPGGGHTSVIQYLDSSLAHLQELTSSFQWRDSSMYTKSCTRPEMKERKNGWTKGKKGGVQDNE